MSINSAIGSAMLNAASGAVLGKLIGDLTDDLQDEQYMRESAQADAAALRRKVRALESYVKILEDVIRG
ncbi:MAG: hypothetical protein H7252_02410 [Cytophaga sp.]|nr:hypothetical protein [Undibacterium sp.]